MMFDKIKTYPYKQLASQLNDLRNLGLVFLGIIVLLVSWSGIKVIQTNYQLQKQIAQLEQQVAVAELENQNLRLKNQYYNTDQFLELAARRQFGKAAPGETLVVVPKETALKYVTAITTKDDNRNATESEKAWYAKNFQAWIDFFLNRQD